MIFYTFKLGLLLVLATHLAQAAPRPERNVQSSEDGSTLVSRNQCLYNNAWVCYSDFGCTPAGGCTQCTSKGGCSAAGVCFYYC
ncbi:hypothetical protein LY78DRAFT_664718 [Colletotrichum sublineola]|nr:hypothetical protein LY78DRAFT_664718 [Colletotrichum sublineola]